MCYMEFVAVILFPIYGYSLYCILYTRCVYLTYIAKIVINSLIPPSMTCLYWGSHGSGSRSIQGIICLIILYEILT